MAFNFVVTGLQQIQELHAKATVIPNTLKTLLLYVTPPRLEVALLKALAVDQVCLL